MKGGRSMGKMQRTKGAQGERRVSNQYTLYLGRKSSRNLDQYQKSDGRDISGCEPYCVQSKKGKAINIYQAYAEAKSAVNTKYKYPVAHISYDRKDPLVVISEDLWWTIIQLIKDDLQ